MSNVSNKIKLSDSLFLAECKDGFWLYDSNMGFNIAMRASSAQEAFTEALTFYQKRLGETSSHLQQLQYKVQGFVELFVQEVEYGSSSDIPSTVLEINI